MRDLRNDLINGYADLESIDMVNEVDNKKCLPTYILTHW